MDQESNDEQPNMFKRIQIWSEEDTRLLLDLYTKYFSDIGPLKRFRHKKEMWAHIASEIPGKAAKQCEERYKTVLKRRKKPSVDKYLTLKKQKTHFEEEPNEKFLYDDSFNPDLQISSQFEIKKEFEEEEEEEEAVVEEEVAKVNDSQQNKTIQEVLLEIAAKKEEGRERRHREKLHALNRIQIMLQKILENKAN